MFKTTPDFRLLFLISMDMPNIAGNMKDWQYTFDAVSKETWLSQVEKDLRGKSLESLFSEWWPGEPLQPLIHAEDASQQVVRLPNHLFAKPPLITEYINTESTSVNANIHDALTYGAEKIIIKCDDLDLKDLDTWLDGVHLDMVSVQLDISDLSSVNLSALANRKAKKIHLRINRNTQSVRDLNEVTSTFTKAGIEIENLRFVYSFDADGAFDELAISCLNQLLDDLKSWVSSGRAAADFFNHITLRLKCHSTYFRQIIQTRVLNLLWLNILDHFKAGTDATNAGYLECHIEGNGMDDPDKYLISASMSGLAASVAGTPSLCIHHLSNPEVKSFYRRSNRNIQHLLNLESNMYQGTDPLAGAYAIDLYTMRWTQRIWEGLNL